MKGTLPVGVLIGQDSYTRYLEDFLREHLAGVCQVARVSTTDEVIGALESNGSELSRLLTDRPVALFGVVVGEGEPTADAVLRPLLDGREALSGARVAVFTTVRQQDGLDWLTDSGRLSWLGFAPGLKPETLIRSMLSQLDAFACVDKSGAISETTRLFDHPQTDSEIVERVLERIEEKVDKQPRIKYPPGIRLTTRGRWVEQITFVLEGSVALLHDRSAGNIVMHEESTGRIVGLLAASEGRRALLDAVTTSDVTAVRLTIEQLKQGLKGDREVALLVATLFIRSLDRRLRRAEALHIENVELAEQLDTERHNLATGLKNLEAARTEHAAQERLSSLGALSSGIAHEINNPMASIQRIASYLAEDIHSLLATAQDQKWAGYALKALANAAEGPSLSSRAERELRKNLYEVTGDQVAAQRLTLAGVRDLDVARQLNKRSGISLEGAEHAASIGTQLRNLRSASTRITDLVASLRSFARPDNDLAEDVDLNLSLDDSLRLLSHKLHNIEVIRDYSDLPFAEGHPGQLAQVWTNVLVNAAEAIGEEAGLAETSAGKIGAISVRTSVVNDRWLRTEITDTGPGIPNEVLPHIFEPRFTTKLGQVRFGMGVGLGVARSIVGKHRGTMRIDTGSEGTRVTVDLPIKAQQEEQ